MKKTRISESQLHKVIKESVNKVLKEQNAEEFYDEINLDVDEFAQHIAEKYGMSDSDYAHRLYKGFMSVIQNVLF